MLMKNSTSASTVSAIAAFADRAASTSLKPDARKLYKRNILDSLGCAISALPGAPFAALREQFAEYRSGGSCTLIGGGKTAPDQATLFNSGLVRYVDLLDSYMSPGKLFGLSDEQIAHAISIATVDNISLTCVHVEPVSQWKGFSPGMTGMRAVYSASLAKRGFTGPSGLFEGPNGLLRMLDQKIDVDWSNDSLEIIKSTIMKKFCSLIHGQPVLEAVLMLKRDNNLAAEDIEAVRCDIFQSGFDIAGGGAFGPKDRPQTKEQADYNLKYLIAAALLDDEVGPAQLEQSRVQAADAQALLSRVEIRPDDAFTAKYPHELNTRIVIKTKDGRTFDREQAGYEGGLGNPMSWERTVEKFNWLSEPFADAALRHNIVEAVVKIDERPIADLMGLLGKVNPKAVYPAFHPGIQ